MICGFWRRLAALAIDWVILAIPLEIFGWVYFDWLSRIGDSGAVIGIVVAVAYFGILGSTLAHGQTVGMRACRIRIVDAQGNALSPLRSFLRYTIFWVPVALEDAALPGHLDWAVGVMLFLIAYLYLFNRRTRQSLHDLATGAYVIRDAKTVLPIRQKMWAGHWAIAAGCMAAGCVVALVLVPKIRRVGPFPELLALQQSLAASGKLSQVGVQAGTKWADGGTSHYMSVTAVWNGKPENYENGAAELAAIALRADPEIMKRDYLVITIESEFNLGIASGHLSRSFSHPPRDWQQIGSSSENPAAP